MAEGDTILGSGGGGGGSSVVGKTVNPADELAKAEAKKAFHAGLPEEYRDNGAIQNLASMDDLLKGFVNQRSYISSSIRIPGEDAGDEDKAEFYSKITDVPGVIRLPENEDTEGWGQVFNTLGRPDTAEGYAGDTPAEIKTAMHKLGMSAAQGEHMGAYINSRINGSKAADAETMKTGLQSLRDEWGDAYDRKVQNANIAIRDFGGEALQKELNSDVIGNHPELIKTFAKIAESMSPDHIRLNGDGQGSGGKYGISAAEAQEQIDAVMANKDHVYWHPEHPNHDKELLKVNRLYEVIYSG